jgi:hypothetical protein
MICSAEEFVRLRTSKEPSEYLRAANDCAPVEVWCKVLAEFPEMRRWVAHNKTVPTEILSLLARDAPELIARLAEDEDATVRERVAYNRKTQAGVLQVLCSDGEEVVAVAARRRLTKSVSSD